MCSPGTFCRHNRPCLGMILAWLILVVIFFVAGRSPEAAAADRSATGRESSPSAPGPRRPNVLMIAIDDLNDWVGPLKGHPLVSTPHMDQLAAQGTTFTNAHCQAPLCNPSRTSLLTGLRPSTTGVYALNVWFRDQPRYANLRTLPQHFMDHGYQVTSTGKIFHDAYPPGKRPDGVEVTTWGPRGSMQPRPARKFVQTPSPNPLVDWGIFPEKNADCFDYDLATFAVDYLKQPPKQPWMLCVGFRHPHVPCYAPAEWFDLYPATTALLPPAPPDDRDDVPHFAWYLNWKLPEPRLDWLQQQNEWVSLTRAYLASVSFVDAMVGRVLNQLKLSGEAENTIIVLWSDHGWHLGEKDLTGKNTLWDRSTRVPLIFAGPGIAVNAKCHQPAELLDLYPTLAELCQLPEQQQLEGLSLRPQLENAATARRQPALTTHGPGNDSVRTDRWRYIRYADGSEELYDMQQDPQELKNLAKRAEFASRKQELAQHLPQASAPPQPGGNVRLLERRGKVYYWEGEPIDPTAPVPQK